MIKEKKYDDEDLEIVSDFSLTDNNSENSSSAEQVINSLDSKNEEYNIQDIYTRISKNNNNLKFKDLINEIKKKNL